MHVALWLGASKVFFSIIQLHRPVYFCLQQIRRIFTQFIGLEIQALTFVRTLYILTQFVKQIVHTHRVFRRELHVLNLVLLGDQIGFLKRIIHVLIT